MAAVSSAGADLYLGLEQAMERGRSGSNNTNTSLAGSTVVSIESLPPPPPPGHFPRLFPRPSLTVVLVTCVVVTGLSLAATTFCAPIAEWLHMSQAKYLANLFKYSSIPIVMVPFTYAHIWLALYMTFFPLRFRGCCQVPGTNVGLGWQGIVPFKGEDMARMAVDTLTTKLVKVQEIMNRLDPKVVGQLLEPSLSSAFETIIADVAQEEFPTVWNALPSLIKQKVFSNARSMTAPAAEKMIVELQDKIDDVLDLEDLVVKKLTGNPALANSIFIGCAHKELAFIRNAGAWMGGIFGTVQMIVWIYYPYPWLLPAIGVLVGAITNYLALLWIFAPLNPIRINLCCCFSWMCCCFRRCGGGDAGSSMTTNKPTSSDLRSVALLSDVDFDEDDSDDSSLSPGSFAGSFGDDYSIRPRNEQKQESQSGCCSFTLHGLFLRRQREVSRSYAALVAKQVLTGKTLLHGITSGPKSAQLYVISQSSVGATVDQAVLFLKPAINAAKGAEAYDRIKQKVIDRVNAQLPTLLDSIAGYIEEACDLEQTLYTRMKQLPYKDFEGLLRPIFQAEEWKLVLMGGALGAVIGVIQVLSFGS